MGGRARENANGGLSLSFCFGRSGHGVHHSAIRLRAFPLGLLEPRCLCAALLLANAPCSALARVPPLFWGRKESSPQLRAPPRSFGVRPRTTPPTSFSTKVRFVARFVSLYCKRAAALTRGPGRPSRKCPRPENPYALDPPSRSHAQPAPQSYAMRGGRLLETLKAL